MADGPNAMAVELVDIDSLILDPENVRKRKDVADLVASLRELGQHRPVVARRDTRRVIAGNHLMKAAQALGWTKVNVEWTDDDDVAARRRALADNLTADRGSYDQVQLRSILEELGEDAKAIPGLDDNALARLLADVSTPEDPPVFPLTAKIGEGYGYVVVVASTSVDCAWLEDTFGVRREQSYKSAEVNVSRVVTVERLRDKWKADGRDG